MNTNTKNILKTIAFIVIPFGSILAAVHYAPKIKKWYKDKKEKNDTEQ